MKAMVLKEYNQPLVYCEDYPDPVIREENDVIIKITACGLCTTDIKVQHGVLETGGIEKTADGAAAGGKSIDIDSLVSMNMWALTPEFVDLLESGFVEFFEKAAPANPLKAEYLLPIYIDELLHADKVSVKVLPTHDKWFGVTYAEDKQTVIDSFARLVADGVYKKDLFSDLKK